MSAFQGLTDQQGRLPVSTTAAITHGFRGLPFAGSSIAVVLDSGQSGKTASQALSFAAGRLVVDSVSAISHSANGLPFTADGALAVANGATVSHHAQGVPFESLGRVVVSGLTTRAPRSLRTERDENILTEDDREITEG